MITLYLSFSCTLAHTYFASIHGHTTVFSHSLSGTQTHPMSFSTFMTASIFLSHFLSLICSSFLILSISHSFNVYLFPYKYFCIHFTLFIFFKKKRRWCAWDSNSGPQGGRRRRNHGAFATARYSFYLPSPFSYLHTIKPPFSLTTHYLSHNITVPNNLFSYLNPCVLSINNIGKIRKGNFCKLGLKA